MLIRYVRLRPASSAASTSTASARRASHRRRFMPKVCASAGRLVHCCSAEDGERPFGPVLSLEAEEEHALVGAETHAACAERHGLGARAHQGGEDPLAGGHPTGDEALEHHLE